MAEIDQITIGQISAAIVFIGALFAGIVKLKKSIKEWFAEILKDKFKELEDGQKEILKKIEDVEVKVKNVDIENCKNYLVTFLAEVERGELKDQIEMERFHEELDHYFENHGNSYVKEKYEYLKKKNYVI